MIDPRRDNFDRRSSGDPNNPSSSRSNSMQYQFTPEELRVLKECNRESFFNRCVPIATLLGLGTYYGVQSGYLKGHARFGSAPKVIVSVIIGYFVGKVSYQTKCSEKLMKLPDSKIGQMLRNRKKGFLQETLDPGVGAGMALAPFSSADKTDQYSDLAPMSDIDTSRPDHEGLDDSFRPSVDSSPVFEDEMPPVHKEVTTYEELRKRNREEFQQQRTTNIRSPTIPQTSAQQASPDQHPPAVKTKTNKYGDALI